MKKLSVFIIAMLVLVGCKTTKEEDYKAKSTGTINSLSVVITNSLWNDKVGDTVRSLFAAPVEGFSTDEPIFSIHQMPPGVFTDFARNSRNVLIVQKGDTNIAGVTQDEYAAPQQVAVITGTNEAEIIRLLKENAPSLIANFKKHELEENLNRLSQTASKEKALEEEFGISLTLPSNYKITTQRDNFFWIKRQIKNYEAGIFVYEVPINKVPNDSTRVNALINIQDAVGKANVPGRDPETMYMQTEKAFAPSIYETTIDNRFAIESKGLWEMKNFLMGGPYVSYFIADEANKRYIVVQGFVFAPQIDKRDYMFELETIAKSIKFKEDEDFSTSAKK